MLRCGNVNSQYSESSALEHTTLVKRILIHSSHPQVEVSLMTEIILEIQEITNRDFEILKQVVLDLQPQLGPEFPLLGKDSFTTFSAMVFTQITAVFESSFPPHWTSEAGWEDCKC